MSKLMHVDGIRISRKRYRSDVPLNVPLNARICVALNIIRHMAEHNKRVILRIGG